ncbi:MAG: hypothetical protein QXH91_09755, partial [Candidatus Bathyarchaeia archaeon]
MSRDMFKSSLKAITGDIDLNEVKNALEKVTITKEKPENTVEWLLKETDFWGKFRRHPLVRKIIDWGNISRECRKSNVYRRIEEKLARMVSRQQVEIEDLIETRDLLRELKNVVLDFVEKQAGDVEQGLRHIHAPGSVARKEARNLYFGEEFTYDDLYKLASRLCDSISLGDSIGIYSEDKDFMLKMSQFIESFGFGSSFKVERDKLREMRIQEYDINHPYIVFLKFVLWLRNQIDIEENQEKKAVYLSVLNRLQSATINMFFMPPNREKWCTIALPRL